MTKCAKEMLNNTVDNRQVQIPMGLDELANNVYWSSVG